jgi:hypothetical protein
LIIEHPAIRRTLDLQRAWVDGGRVLAYQTGIYLDMARHAESARERDQAQQWCSLITPVLKAAWTQQAFEGSSACLQVFGGHGYIREWGIEQIVRDSRVAMIYEGTNEIQAIDLLVRKVLPDGGQAMGQWLLTLRNSLDAGRALDAEVLRCLAQLRYSPRRWRRPVRKMTPWPGAWPTTTCAAWPWCCWAGRGHVLRLQQGAIVSAGEAPASRCSTHIARNGLASDSDEGAVGAGFRRARQPAVHLRALI